MIDPFSIAADMVGVLNLAAKIKEIAGSEVISAHLAWDGSRISGSEKITVTRHVDEAS